MEVGSIFHVHLEQGREVTCLCTCKVTFMAEEYEVEASRLDGKFTRVVDFSQIAMMILPGGITIMKNMGIHKLLLLIYVELRQEEGIQVHFNLFLIVCF